MKIDEKLLEGLSDELKKKVLQCQSKEELDALINGYDGSLSDEQLDVVAGGGHCRDKGTCRIAIDKDRI